MLQLRLRLLMTGLMCQSCTKQDYIFCLFCFVLLCDKRDEYLFEIKKKNCERIVMSISNSKIMNPIFFQSRAALQQSTCFFFKHLWKDSNTTHWHLSPGIATRALFTHTISLCMQPEGLNRVLRKCQEAPRVNLFRVLFTTIQSLMLSSTTELISLEPWCEYECGSGLAVFTLAEGCVCGWGGGRWGGGGTPTAVSLVSNIGLHGRGAVYLQVCFLFH